MVNIKPTLVLTVITAVISALLIITSSLVRPDANVLSKPLLNKCISVMGDGEYEIVTDWQAAGYNIDKPKSVDKLIKKSDGTLAFQIITSGYSKDGINILAVMNTDGSIKNIAIVEIADIPGLGAESKSTPFIEQFIGKSENIKQFDAVANATYSSRGVVKAINTAIEVYAQMGVKE